MSDRICLVEDDPTISQFVAEKLKSRGYLVDAFLDPAPLWQEKVSFHWDLYILDVLLPGEVSGLELCQKIRQKNPLTPILFLSALSEPSDRIEGLKAGGDDYLTKPFEMEELLLRVEGMLKRRSWYRALPAERSVYSWDDNSIDFVNLEGRSGDRKFSMTQKECMVMKLLIERENQVVSRDEILNQVWGYDVYPSTRTVDNFILRLRKLFEKERGGPKYLTSVRGAGYRFSSKGSVG